ncbi:putative disease resistance protein RGA3 [Prunus avium]|uniref:Disease resistance protein RGA3 n=1 Tax=Prunus avium TaxID=42229 RepID=A0A6P5SHR7_PRUAV|nr:putative disease resistance protein RGA3 [Prunus avium]
MADALIPVLLRQLAEITYQQIEKEVRLVLDVKKEVAKITSNLKAIQAVLEDAEKRQVKEATVRDWLEKLKDVSYEMDDVLDEWNTEFLRQQVEKQEEEEEGKDALVAKKKVCFSIPCHCFCFNQVSRVILRRDIALKIKDLNDRLNEIAIERQTYNFQTTEKGIEHRPERMGGIGKTTLAQLVYNDESIKAHFEKRIWVCVSEPFDTFKIAKAIIDGNGTPNSDGLEAFLQCVSKSVEGKKFLLVLDDMWTQDHREWEQLKLPLQNGSTGSKILVTKRKEGVAIMMGAESDMIRLNELSETYCWSLFHHIACFDRREEESNVFEAIGKEIVKKCKGLPLAAKTLSSLMRFKKTREEWEDVLHSKIWELKEIEQEVFQPLLLSYYDLALAIRNCLLYCVIFPKGYVFTKKHLIELWMAQDYLNLEGDKNKEIVGQNYFNNLVMRSFFQDFAGDDFGNVRYKMHDIVHDFVQFLTKKEAFVIEVKDANKRIELRGYKVRHLTLIALEDPYGSRTSLLAPVSSEICKSMRTLATFGSRISTLDPDFILQLKALRTLNLSENDIEELPKEIGELIQLRYVDLSRNYPLVELPNTKCNLYNLQTLCLDYCRQLATLPKAMGKLIKLKHRHVMCCDGLKYLPKGIGRLTSLRALDQFPVCGGDDENDTFKLGDLRLLDKLEGSLFISELGNLTDASEVKKARLWNKKHILHLRLDFSNGDNAEGDRKSDVEILNVLEGPQNLKSLDIGFRNQLKISNIPNISINYESIREEGVWIQGYDETDTSDFDEGDDEIVQE